MVVQVLTDSEYLLRGAKLLRRVMGLLDVLRLTGLVYLLREAVLLLRAVAGVEVGHALAGLLDLLRDSGELLVLLDVGHGFSESGVEVVGTNALLDLGVEQVDHAAASVHDEGQVGEEAFWVVDQRQRDLRSHALLRRPVVLLEDLVVLGERRHHQHHPRH